MSGKLKSWKTRLRGWTHWHTRQWKKAKAQCLCNTACMWRLWLCYVSHHPGQVSMFKFHKRHSSPSLHSDLLSPARDWWPSGFCTLSFILLTQLAVFQRTGKGWFYHMHILEIREVKWLVHKISKVLPASSRLTNKAFVQWSIYVLNLFSLMKQCKYGATRLERAKCFLKICM